MDHINGASYVLSRLKDVCNSIKKSSEIIEQINNGTYHDKTPASFTIADYPDEITPVMTDLKDAINELFNTFTTGERTKKENDDTKKVETTNDDKKAKTPDVNEKISHLLQAIEDLCSFCLSDENKEPIPSCDDCHVTTLKLQL